MRVFKRGSVWWYDFTINGKRHRGPTKRTKESDAKRVMAEVYKNLMDANQFGIKQEIALSDAFDMSIKEVSGATATSYRLAKRKWLGLDAFEGPEFWSLPEGIKLHELTPELLKTHKAERIGEGLRNNSVNVEIRVLKRVQRNCLEYRTNDSLRFDMLPSFTKTRFLTRHEEEDVWDYLNKHDGESYKKAQELYVFLRDTGARISEALNCRMSDFNLTDRTFEVYRVKTKSESYIPLSTRTVEILKRKDNQRHPFIGMSRAIRVLRKSIDVTCNDDDRLVEQRGRATIHTLRDTYASHLVKKGLNLNELAKMLGHTTAAMAGKYGHLTSKDVLDKVRGMIE